MTCDYCDQGVLAVNGWHVIVDPEGFEGDMRVPCPKVRVPDITARARRTDPGTSHDAAASVTHISDTQSVVLATFRMRGPMTDEDLVSHRHAIGVSPSGCRTRRAELVAMGLLRDSGERGLTESGRKSIIWEATPKELTLW